MTEKVTISLIIGASLIVAASTGAIISTISKNKERDFQSTQVLIKEKKIQDCLTKVLADYQYSWNASCTKRGLGNNCSLPTAEANNQNSNFKVSEDRCVKMY